MNIKMVLPLMVLLCPKFVLKADNNNINVFENHTNTSCPYSNDGNIILAVVGTPPFSFDWTSSTDSLFSSTSQNLDNLFAGIYTAVISDTMGCSASISVEVLAGEDNIAPEIECPDNQTFNLDPGACDYTYEFEILMSDNCSNLTLSQTDTTGLQSSDAFNIGTNELSFTVSDGFQSSSCSFTVTVNEYVVIGNPVFSCSSALNVALGENCEPGISPGTILNTTQHGCYDDYVLEYFNNWGWPVTDFSDYINETINVQVSDPESGNNCSTSITLFDNLKPKILPMDTLTFSCGHNLNTLHPGVTGYPTVDENCSGFVLTFSDEVTNFDCSDTLNANYKALITRTWLAIDQQDNLSLPYEQIILIERNSLANVQFPLNLTGQSGQLPSLPCGSNQTAPAFTGSPSIDGIPLYPDPMFCDLSADYTDVQLPGCGEGFDILRTWTVFDECNNTVSNHLQVISLKDQGPPLISCPENISQSTNQNTCAATFFIPSPTVTDDCSNFDIDIYSSAGIVSGSTISNVPLGTHTITYNAYDDCGNQSQCLTQVQVYDGASPVVICHPSKQVSLGSNGTANLIAATLNSGSHDDCSNSLSFQIKKLSDLCELGGTEWSNSIQFCCEEVGIPIPVEVRVTDLFGNYNNCSSVVHVSDAISPSMFCPTDVQIECDFDYSDLSVFGKVAESQSNQEIIEINGEVVGQDGLATDNCSLVIEELDPLFDINDCGTGLITRTFKAVDASNFEKSCVQHIYIENNNPFYINLDNLNDPENDVIFPPNITLSGCDVNTAPSNTGIPIIQNEQCAQVSYSHQDDVFNQPGNSYLIIREWTIIDFCQLGANSGIWKVNQNIQVENTDILPPEFNGAQEIWSFCSESSDCSTGEVDLTIFAQDNCSPQNELLWTHTIDLYNDGTVDLFGNTSSVTGEFPLGIHRIVFSVSDGNGNTAYVTQFMFVEDCLPPLLSCSDLSIDLDENGSVHLEAGDFLVNVDENCSPIEELQLYLSFYDSDYEDVLPPNESLTFLSLGCPDTLYHLSLFSGDELNNWSKCDFMLKVNDTENYCNQGEPTISISGNILTEEGEVVEQVEINVNNNPPEASSNGFYAFYNLPYGGDYSVFPYKNSDPLNGVTTLDLVIIRKHILGIESLDSPYKMIAADANRSNAITTLDLVEIRRLILNINQEFTNNTSWRFVDASFEFSNPEDPFSNYFPELVSFNNLFENGLANFIGIKTGDVNGSADPAMGLQAAEDREHTQEVFREEIEVLAPYPNPFVYSLNFNIYLPKDNKVSIQILSSKGELVYEERTFYEAGSHKWTFEKEVSEGIYFYKVVIEDQYWTGKVVRSISN